MPTNEILEEIWKFREEYAAKFNYDLTAMCQDMKKREQESGHKIVSFADEELEVSPDQETALAKAS